MLQAKQMQLREVLSGGGEGKAGPTPEERQLEQQREEYGRRGIRCGAEGQRASRSTHAGGGRPSPTCRVSIVVPLTMSCFWASDACPATATLAAETRSPKQTTRAPCRRNNNLPAAA